MALSVKKAVLWRREIEHRPGTLAESLKPFAKAGVNLQVVMGYSSPGKGGVHAMEVFPVADAKAEQAAKEAGLHPAKEVHCVTVDGDDHAGIAYEMTNAIASAGINLNFAMLQAVNKRFNAVLGFSSDKDADKAVELLGKLSSKLVESGSHRH